MPTAPKSKSTLPRLDLDSEETLWLWNHGKEKAGQYHAHTEMLHIHVPSGEGKDRRVDAIMEPVNPGLCRVRKSVWERALAEAKRSEERGAVHRIATRHRRKELEVVDPTTMTREDLVAACEQTASKTMIDLLIKLGGTVGEVAAETKRNWRSEERSHVMAVTAHLASYGRSGG
jgi:hypothetical protein